MSPAAGGGRDAPKAALRWTEPGLPRDVSEIHDRGPYTDGADNELRAGLRLRVTY